MTKARLWLVAVAALTMLAGCTPTPSPSQQVVNKPVDCGVGGNAREIAAGFFALFQDRPECF